jgi:(S)-2-hydroxyglutarate dehydrogenase
MRRVDIAIVGGGIVGLSVARALLSADQRLKITVLEKESSLAVHQSGRNSGVLHTGIYYRPGSWKSRIAAAGRRAMVTFCEDNGVPFEICGKVILAGEDSERPRLVGLAERARDNGVRALFVGPEHLRELEPHAAAIAALHVPEAGIVDFPAVCRALAVLVERGGVEICMSCEVSKLIETASSVVAESARGPIEARVVVNCAGLQSDRLMTRSERRGGVRIVPFRGEYYELAGKPDLVRNLIYPVPDQRMPFLGVHLTRSIDGSVLAGPNAVLALAREGYAWSDVDPRELLELVAFPHLRRLAARHWRTGLHEVVRSLSKRAFLGSVQRLVPEVRGSDLVRARSGVRAQAVRADGSLVDDFVIAMTGRNVTVLSAPSPAATASLVIGEQIASRAVALL